jgi:hypothetical protein
MTFWNCKTSATVVSNQSPNHSPPPMPSRRFLRCLFAPAVEHFTGAKSAINPVVASPAGESQHWSRLQHISVVSFELRATRRRSPLTRDALTPPEIKDWDASLNTSLIGSSRPRADMPSSISCLHSNFNTKVVENATYSMLGSFDIVLIRLTCRPGL